MEWVRKWHLKTDGGIKLPSRNRMFINLNGMLGSRKGLYCQDRMVCRQIARGEKSRGNCRMWKTYLHLPINIYGMWYWTGFKYYKIAFTTFMRFAKLYLLARIYSYFISAFIVTLLLIHFLRLVFRPVADIFISFISCSIALLLGGCNPSVANALCSPRKDFW